MTAKEITAQLERIADAEDFVGRSYEMTDRWTSAGVGLESLEPVLRFMEAHPCIEYGSPGPVVHFVERFHDDEYTARLLESVARRPTAHTLWMLNRVINGAIVPETRMRLFEAMELAKRHPLADEGARNEAEHFLKRLL